MVEGAPTDTTDIVDAVMAAGIPDPKGPAGATDPKEPIDTMDDDIIDDIIDDVITDSAISSEELEVLELGGTGSR